MASNTCGIDIETYSDVDIKNGAYAYADAPDFEIILVSYKLGDEPVKVFMPSRFKAGAGTTSDGEQISFIQGEDFEETGDEDEFLRILADPDIIKTAFNANFERTCLASYYGIKCDPDEWRCTMILASQLGLPRSLKDVGDALGLAEDQKKLKTGRSLIQYFCKPCKPTKANGGRVRNYPRHDPDKWRLFMEYNVQDVVTEQVILGKLSKYKPIPQEQALWSTDQRICDRGIRINKEMAAGIVEYTAEHQEELLNEARQITHLVNPNSIAQLKGWFGQKKQFSLSEDCSKAAIAAALGRPLPPEVRRICEIRQSLGKTSTKKYDAMLASVCKDGRVRGMLQFYGANRTGRWAGRIVQLQNLPQNHIEDLDEVHDIVCDQDFETLELIYGDPAQIFSELIRTAFIPSDGNQFVVTDFSAIEARVIAWLADETWRVKVFEDGGDIYCESASMMFKVPVKKHGINGHLRQQGKVAELALGYGGGPGAIAQMDKGGAIPEADRKPIVDMWRKSSPRIVSLWGDIEQAAMKAIKTKASAAKPVVVGLKGGMRHKYTVYSNDGMVAADTTAVSAAQAINNVRHNLAGEMGRYTNEDFHVRREKDLNRQRIAFYMGDGILFCRLPSGRSIAYWGARIEEGTYGPQIAYYGVGDTKSWTLLRTYGGKLTENVIQAIARDCLAVKMMQAEEMGYEVVAHVHDEMILDVPLADTEAFDKIDGLMAEPIDWAPGLPLKGGTYECPYYQKD